MEINDALARIADLEAQNAGLRAELAKWVTIAMTGEAVRDKVLIALIAKSR